jgi:hypothetical protein
MGTNLLFNPGFELGKFNKVDQWGSMTVPEGWLPFFVNDTGHDKVPWDRNNDTGICAPEYKPVPAVAPYLNPPRVMGNWAMCWFSFLKVMDAGLMQTVKVTRGQTLRMSAFAHGWSCRGTGDSPHPDDPKWSEGVGYGAHVVEAHRAWPMLTFTGNQQTDAIPNMLFQVGIDPTGETNPLSSSVIWGSGAHIYNVYDCVPCVEAVAQGDTVTVFLRTRNLWGFPHNDAYWDDASLEVVAEPGPQPGFYVLLPEADLPTWGPKLAHTKWNITSNADILGIPATKPGCGKAVNTVARVLRLSLASDTVTMAVVCNPSTLNKPLSYQCSNESCQIVNATVNHIVCFPKSVDELLDILCGA